MNIAISGKVGAGKSLLAQVLRDNHGYSICTLATPIYAAADLARRFIETDSRPKDTLDYLSTLTTPENAEVMYGRWLELVVEFQDELRSGKKCRGFLQTFGMAFRELDSEVFIRACIASANGGGHFCCDDTRMPNEAQAFREAGWKLVRIVVPEDVQLARVEALGYDKSRLGHITESALDDWSEWDYVFNGACPKDEVPERVRKMLERLNHLR